jgi:hypothetical protein
MDMFVWVEPLTLPILMVQLSNSAQQVTTALDLIKVQYTIVVKELKMFAH